MKKTTIGLKELFRTIRKANGLEVKGDINIGRRLLAEGYVRNISITSLETFVRLFGDGKYFLECYDVVVEKIKEESFYINYMCIEAECSDNQWSVQVRTDEEEIIRPDLKELEARSNKITVGTVESFKLVSAVIQMAGGLKDLITGHSG